MAGKADTGLAKVLVVSPERQLELALPEHLPVAALLPVLLRHGGEDLAADGVKDGGWVLRRADGAPLDGGRSLAEQEIRDGELLHLQPRWKEWPELQYDDIVDAIAAGARRGGPAWDGRATRVGALFAAVAALALGPPLLLASGPPWLVPASVLLALAGVLMIAGTVLSRAVGDSVAGAVIGAVALPYAFFGGLLVLGGDLGLRAAGAPQLLLACSVLLAASVAGYVGVADLRAVFIAGLVVSLGGALGAALTLAWTDAVGGAAVVAVLFLILAPGIPLLSVRLAKVPMPAVPRDAEDLRSGDVLPPLDRVMDLVGQSLELLAGALLGVSVVTAATTGILALSGQGDALALAAVVSAAHLLRARMLVALRQRLPLAVAGGLGLVWAGAGLVLVAPDWVRYGVVLPLLGIAAVVALVAGASFARRPPSPYLGRLADIGDVLLTLVAAPLAAGVVGLYGVMRGLNG